VEGTRFIICIHCSKTARRQDSSEYGK